MFLFVIVNVSFMNSFNMHDTDSSNFKHKPLIKKHLIKTELSKANNFIVVLKTYSNNEKHIEIYEASEDDGKKTYGKSILSLTLEQYFELIKAIPDINYILGYTKK